MKTKRQRKMTRKLLSMFAAAAIIASQIPAGMSANAAGTEAIPQDILSVQNLTDVSFDTIVLGIICIKCSFNIRFKKNKQ